MWAIISEGNNGLDLPPDRSAFFRGVDGKRESKAEDQATASKVVCGYNEGYFDDEITFRAPHEFFFLCFSSQL